MITTMTPELRALVTTIRDDFGGSPAAYAARPYVEALLEVADGGSYFYEDSVKDCVIYLRSNLGGWRGELARATKAQLDALIAGYALHSDLTKCAGERCAWSRDGGHSLLINA